MTLDVRKVGEVKRNAELLIIILGHRLNKLNSVEMVEKLTNIFNWINIYTLYNCALVPVVVRNENVFDLFTLCPDNHRQNTVDFLHLAV